MITEFELRGFKRFAREEFRLKPLTILAGLNGSGKTSVIQALLLAWEASVGGNGSIVRLNGPFGLELGTADDVRNWKSAEFVELRLVSGDGGVSFWRFSFPADDALYLRVEDKPKPVGAPKAITHLPRAFCYLCAERLGPRGVSVSAPVPEVELEIGARGEYCAQIVETLGDKPIEYAERLHPEREKDASTLLKYEVERWLSEIARPVEIDAERYVGANLTGLRFRSPGGDWVRAPNMGFGVSYALPIILAGLTIINDGLLIVESPEAHLHPAGQSRMGSFLAWLAGKGVQVIIETHSDHVLNGVRRAIGEHHYLAADDAAVQFFDAEEGDEPKIHRLGFTAIGGVSDWPAGFFDQYQIDVASLGRVRRRV